MPCPTRQTAIVLHMNARQRTYAENLLAELDAIEASYADILASSSIETSTRTDGAAASSMLALRSGVGHRVTMSLRPHA